jgi:hypothetical protein
MRLTIVNAVTERTRVSNSERDLGPSSRIGAGLPRPKPWFLAEGWTHNDRLGLPADPVAGWASQRPSPPLSARTPKIVLSSKLVDEPAFFVKTRLRQSYPACWAAGERLS